MSAIETATGNGRMRESVRRFAVWTLAMLVARAACALTPLSAIRFSSDITVNFGGTLVTPQNVAQDNLAGAVSFVNIGTIPTGTDVIGYHLLANGDQLLSFDTTVSMWFPACVSVATCAGTNGESVSFVRKGATSLFDVRLTTWGLTFPPPLSSGPVTVTLSLAGTDEADQANCRAFGGRGKLATCR